MSGHSKWRQTIKRKRRPLAAQKGKVWSRLAERIIRRAAVVSDPSMNARLRLAVDAAEADRYAARQYRARH